MKELSDNELQNIFAEDRLNCQADPSIESRLNYAFMLKNSQNKIHQNSIFGGFASLFSLKHISIKAAFVSVLIIVSFLNFQKDGDTQISPLTDTCKVIYPYSLDSANVLPFYGDSCFTMKNL